MSNFKQKVSEAEDILGRVREDPPSDPHTAAQSRLELAIKRGDMDFGEALNTVLEMYNASIYDIPDVYPEIYEDWYHYDDAVPNDHVAEVARDWYGMVDEDEHRELKEREQEQGELLLRLQDKLKDLEREINSLVRLK